MRDAPRLSTFIRKELRTSHIKNLPPVIPHSCVTPTVSLLQVGPYHIFAFIHLRQPILYKRQYGFSQPITPNLLTSHVLA